jgi:hypothetical protein
MGNAAPTQHRPSRSEQGSAATPVGLLLLMLLLLFTVIAAGARSVQA